MKKEIINSYYFHDSQKGYSHGCTEVETELFNKLNDYRKAGHDRIDVIVKYLGPKSFNKWRNKEK